MSAIPGTDIRPTLDEMIEKSKARMAAMTPEEREAMWRRQREGYVRAEMGFGSDADEAEYAAALRSGDDDAIARCRAASRERMAAFDRMKAERGL